MNDFGSDICFTRQGHLFRLRAAAVIIRDKKVLMAGNKRNTYLYSIGGAVQLGESLEEALIREVIEETGQRLTIDRLIAIHQNFFRDSEVGNEIWHELAFYYLMEGWQDNKTKPQSANMNGDEEYLTWIPLKQFHLQNAFPTFFSDLEIILKENKPRMIVTHE